MTHLLRFVSIFGLVLAGGANIEANQNPSQSDIRGGAELIFKRPENPTTRDRNNAPPNKQASVKDDTSGKVEDALALGNAARDRKPPDFESAEKAYRLAWKLNPRDPRPYLGLGNLYWDQRRYPEAAQAYRDALRYIDRSDSRNLLIGIIGSGGLNTANRRTSDIPPGAQTRLYLAATLLEERNPLEAERELRVAAQSLSEDAEWNGLFGYTLSAQGRYSEAAAAYEKALRLEPFNERYKLLLTEVTQKARESSADDHAITSRLQNTTWELRDVGSSTIKGTCELDASGAIRCKSAGSSLAILNGAWRIRDGVFVFDRALSVPFCIGQLRTASIDVKCFRRDREINELWTHLKR